MSEQANGAVELDPKAAQLLARLAAIGGPDDLRDEPARLAEEELVARELAALVAARRAEMDAEAAARDTAEDVDRLRAQALDPAHGDTALPSYLAALASRKKALGIEEEGRVQSLSERLLSRLQRPPLVHVQTSLPTLDAATRGGLLLRRVSVIGGEPDAGKTALLVQILLHAAHAGYAVGLLAVDEPGEGIEDRIGQSFGLALEDLEANVEAAILWLAKEVAHLPHFLLMEQDDGCATIEQAADRLLAHAKRHGCKGAILGVDSLQTARCLAHVGPDAPRFERDRLDATTAALKAQAKRGLGVIVTSELNRGAYADKPGAKPSSPMAAFKGSGSIEYCMMVGMVLTRIRKGEHAGDVKLILPKNKRGAAEYKAAAIRLERDPDRCTYTDRGRIDAAEEEPQGGAGAGPKPKRELDLEPYRVRVRKALAGHPRGFDGNRENLAVIAGGKASSTRAAIAAMFSEGELRVEKKRIRLVAPSSTPAD